VYHTGIILFVVLVVGVVMLRSGDVVTAGMGLGIWCGGTIVHQLANLCWISAPLRGILPPLLHAGGVIRLAFVGVYWA